MSDCQSVVNPALEDKRISQICWLRGFWTATDHWHRQTRPVWCISVNFSFLIFARS